LYRNLILAGLAVFAQGCRQTDRGLGEIPQTTASQGQGLTPEAEQPAPGTRLSYWGVGAPPRSGPAGGAAARLEGVLSRLGGCIVVTPGNGRSVHPVFPAGKAVWGEASGRLRFAGRTYRPGDRIVLGGGGIGSPADYARQPGVEIASCPESDLWAVIA
jgi:hypothetical protein